MNRVRKMISCLLMVVAAMSISMTAYAAGSDVTFKEAGFNTVLGIGTVFIMLVVISLIIYCFKFIPMIQKAFSGKKNPQPEAQKKVEAAPAAPAIAMNETDDLELVAVIAAAIAASEQVPIDSFVVRTIKRRR